MSRQDVFVEDGYGSLTFKMTASDVAQELTEANVENARGVLVTVEDAAIRVAYGGTVPTQAGVGHLFGAGDTFTVRHPRSIKTMQFINAVAAANAVLQITVETGG